MSGGIVVKRLDQLLTGFVCCIGLSITMIIIMKTHY